MTEHNFFCHPDQFNLLTCLGQIFQYIFVNYVPNGIIEVNKSGVYFGQIMKFISREQALLRDRINNLYLVNLDKVEAHREVISQMNFYRNLALFIQIIGLGLIMARDLSRS